MKPQILISSTLFFAVPAISAPPKPAAKPQVKPHAKPTLIVTGRVKAATKPPRPRSVPYKDAVISLHLTGVKPISGKLAPREILVFLWGMRDNKWTPAASYRAGQMVKLRLVPWERVERLYDSYNRFEVEGEAVNDLDIYWAETK